MWHISLDNKELDGGKSKTASRLHGPYLACLTHDQLILIQANNKGGPNQNCCEPVEIPITSIRMCGLYKERMFFEPGRASGIGSGRLWINVHDELMAHNMNDTILNMMYMKQEEGASYRNRSYSSGSNSSRSRSIRSHIPPPSVVGMRKVGPAVSSKRLRCESLPATHFAGLHDPRFRTGSEGETTLRKSSRFNGNRSYTGSVSPAMRNRLHMMRRRNSFAHRRQQNNSHASSFSGSVIASSTSSSAEQLSNVSTNSELSSLVSYDGINFDEFPVSCTPVSVGLQSTQRNGSISRHTKRYTNNWTSPIREGLESFQHTCSCSSNVHSQFPESTSHFLMSSEKIPPPPDVDPPRVPNNYANTFVHTRAQSLDENGTNSTSASSLSSSPNELISLFKNSLTSNHQREDENHLVSSLPPTPKRQSPLTLYSATLISIETKIQNNDQYPHQKISSNRQQASSTSSKSLRRNQSDLEYTPMSLGSVNTKISDGYVPMRSYSIRSNSQDIRYRRRSTPDVAFRNSVSTHPQIELNSVQSVCVNCRNCAQNTKDGVGSSSAKFAICQTSTDLSLKRNSICSNPTDSSHLAPPISESLRISTPSPTSKTVNENLDMNLLQDEISEIKNSLDEPRKDSPTSISKSTYPTPSSESVADLIGYLPMSPIIPGFQSRKDVFNAILSVAESPKTIPMYPHQRKDRTFVSQDKPAKSHRSKRPRSLSFRKSGSFSRRNQKQKSISDAPSEVVQSNSVLSGERSPGGDYVNIDFKKARDQVNNAYVLNLSHGGCRPSVSSRDIEPHDAEYTAMSYNAF